MHSTYHVANNTKHASTQSHQRVSGRYASGEFVHFELGRWTQMTVHWVFLSISKDHATTSCPLLLFVRTILGRSSRESSKVVLWPSNPNQTSNNSIARSTTIRRHVHAMDFREQHWPKETVDFTSLRLSLDAAGDHAGTGHWHAWCWEYTKQCKTAQLGHAQSQADWNWMHLTGLICMLLCSMGFREREVWSRPKYLRVITKAVIQYETTQQRLVSSEGWKWLVRAESRVAKRVTCLSQG